MKQMKHKLQGPSLAPTTSKALGGALNKYSHFFHARDRIFA